MTFVLVFLIASVIGLIIADVVTRIFDKEVERWKKEENHE